MNIAKERIKLNHLIEKFEESIEVFNDNLIKEIFSKYDIIKIIITISHSAESSDIGYGPFISAVELYNKYNTEIINDGITTILEDNYDLFNYSGVDVNPLPLVYNMEDYK